jgi:hypothetical protein
VTVCHENAIGKVGSNQSKLLKFRTILRLVVNLYLNETDSSDERNQTLNEIQEYVFKTYFLWEKSRLEGKYVETQLISLAS